MRTYDEKRWAAEGERTYHAQSDAQRVAYDLEHRIMGRTDWPQDRAARETMRGWALAALADGFALEEGQYFRWNAGRPEPLDIVTSAK